MGCGASKKQEDQTASRDANNNGEPVKEKKLDEEKKEEKKDTAVVPAAAPPPAQEAPPAEEKPKKTQAEKKKTWEGLKGKLPGTKKGDKEQRQARFDLFKQFDPNGNGYLSLAEVDHGCRNILHLDDLTDDLKPILMRAFTAAKGVHQKKGKKSKHGDDFVERSEFRLLLVYIRTYFELWFMFDEIDTGDDRRVSFEEFEKALPDLEGWGVKVTDAKAEFGSIDKNGGGQILFQEFAEWAMQKGLDADPEDASSSDDEKDAASAPPAAAAAAVAAPEATAAPTEKKEEAKKQPKKNVWDELKEKLPTKRSKEEKQKRMELFKQFDPNGNGYLSLAEVDHGCRNVLDLDKLTDDLKPILMRAFSAAKGIRQSKGKKNKKSEATGSDYVERAEFRLLFVYIRTYFELWFMFDEIDTGDDRRVNFEEFEKALPLLEKWGVKITDAKAEFNAIDTNGGGIILFQEFAEWATKKDLDLEEDGESSDDE